MIVDLPDTSTHAINTRLVDLRNSSGTVALGRVLTLVIVADEATAEAAVKTANEASHEHPCRVIVLAKGNKRGATRLDGQIRVGGDAGASEVIVLRAYGQLSNHGASMLMSLLLPDAPVVVWWPDAGPEVPSEDPIGRMAARRITDVALARSPTRVLAGRVGNHAPGDTDLAWSRITRWRSVLAAALDQAPFESVSRVTVAGAPDSPSAELLAAWLAWALDCPVTRKRTDPGSGIVGVTLVRDSGKIVLERPDGATGTLTQPGQPVRRIAMQKRNDAECLSEELRRLDPDDLYGDVVTKGLGKLKSKVSS